MKRFKFVKSFHKKILEKTFSKLTFVKSFSKLTFVKSFSQNLHMSRGHVLSYIGKKVKDLTRPIYNSLFT